MRGLAYVFTLFVVALVVGGLWWHVTRPIYVNNIGNVLLTFMRAPQRPRKVFSKDLTLDRVYEQFNNACCKLSFFDPLQYVHTGLYGACTWQFDNSLQPLGSWTTNSDIWKDEARCKAFRDALLASLPTCTEHDVVIHVRLGDVPFAQWNTPSADYHFQSWQYFEWALARLHVTVQTPIQLVYAVSWQSDDTKKRLSNEYLKRLTHKLSSCGFTVTCQSTDTLTDLATIVRCKHFVGTSGSFSFLGAMGRWDNAALPQSGREYANGVYKLDARPEWMSPVPPVLRTRFKAEGLDYNDINSICTVTGLT